METLQQLKDLLQEVDVDFKKFSEKGNKKAAARARKNLMEIGKLTKTFRAEIQEAKNASAE